MLFFEDNPMELPTGANYYFNVLIICICLSMEKAQLCMPQGCLDYWDISGVTEARPYAVHVYSDDNIHQELERDEDFSVICIPHTVLQEHPTLGISWYRMIDWDTDTPWDLTPTDEDCLD